MELFEIKGYEGLYSNRLVGETFIPNPNNFPQLNHKSEDKTAGGYHFSYQEVY